MTGRPRVPSSKEPQQLAVPVHSGPSAPPCLLPVFPSQRKAAPLPCCQTATLRSPQLCVLPRAEQVLQGDQDEGGLPVDPASAGASESDNTPRRHPKLTAPAPVQALTLFQRKGGFCAQRQMSGPFLLAPAASPSHVPALLPSSLSSSCPVARASGHPVFRGAHWGGAEAPLSSSNHLLPPAPCVSRVVRHSCSSHRLRGAGAGEGPLTCLQRVWINCTCSPPQASDQPAPSPASERALPGLVIWFLLHSGEVKERDSRPLGVMVLTGF